MIEKVLVRFPRVRGTEPVEKLDMGREEIPVQPEAILQSLLQRVFQEGVHLNVHLLVFFSNFFLGDLAEVPIQDKKYHRIDFQANQSVNAFYLLEMRELPGLFLDFFFRITEKLT